METKESSVFELEERSLREEVACLKQLIELAHNIKVYDYPTLPPEHPQLEQSAAK